MNYPLHLSFRIFAFAPQIYITDNNGNEIMYVYQKFFRLKEKVNIYNNRRKEQHLYQVRADRIIDFSARYSVKDLHDNELCSIKQRGWKSIWKTHFDIYDGENKVFQINEENPWIKVLDLIFSSIPIVGPFTGFVFHPSYVISRAAENSDSDKFVMRVIKKTSLVERLFKIEKDGEADLSEREEQQILVSSLMMILLERQRG